MAITVSGVEQVLEPGSAAIVPGDAPHSARVLSACRAIVVDHPSRPDVAGKHQGSSLSSPHQVSVRQRKT